MNKTYLLSFIFLILGLNLVLALSSVELHFISPQEDDFSNNLLTLQIGEGVQKSILLNSTYAFELADGSYSLQVILDSFDTPAPDFYGTADITVNGAGSFDILIFPTGFVQGRVKDNSGNLIPNADLTFNCISSFIVEYPKKTDQTGSFIVSNIPEASCTLIASTADEAGRIEFEVEKGKAQDLEVILESKVVSENNYTTIIFGIVFLLVIIGMAWLIYLKKRKRRILVKEFKLDKEESEDKEGRSSNEEQELSSQTKALLETLSEKEKSIVNFLLEKGNEISQAKIRHATRMPRTSLARVLQGLEAKKIILIEKEGKMVSIKLTSLFLGK